MSDTNQNKDMPMWKAITVGVISGILVYVIMLPALPLRDVLKELLKYQQIQRLLMSLLPICIAILAIWLFYTLHLKKKIQSYKKSNENQITNLNTELQELNNDKEQLNKQVTNLQRRLAECEEKLKKWRNKGKNT